MAVQVTTVIALVGVNINKLLRNIRQQYSTVQTRNVCQRFYKYGGRPYSIYLPGCCMVVYVGQVLIHFSYLFMSVVFLAGNYTSRGYVEVCSGAIPAGALNRRPSVERVSERKRTTSIRPEIACLFIQWLRLLTSLLA